MKISLITTNENINANDPYEITNLQTQCSSVWSKPNLTQDYYNNNVNPEVD